LGGQGVGEKKEKRASVRSSAQSWAFILSTYQRGRGKKGGKKKSKGHGKNDPHVDKVGREVNEGRKDRGVIANVTQDKVS